MSRGERNGQTQRSGSALSRKQIAYTVLNGQRVTFISPSGVEIATGYVFGMDDFHWAVVSPEGETSLVHKAGTHARIHTAHTYAEEANRETLDARIQPFREFVEKEIFNRTPAAVR